jgi:predicted RNase H-like HicB family nuclease
MKTYDVIVQQENGVFRASVIALPNITAEGRSRDEALEKARVAITDFFKTAEVTTVSVDLPSDRNLQNGVETGGAPELSEEEERAQLIEWLEQVEPKTELAVVLRGLRLQMLREGQKLRSLDEINRDLGRDPEREGYVDVC